MDRKNRVPFSKIIICLPTAVATVAASKKKKPYILLYIPNLYIYIFFLFTTLTRPRLPFTNAVVEP